MVVKCVFSRSVSFQVLVCEMELKQNTTETVLEYFRVTSVSNVLNEVHIVK